MAKTTKNAEKITVQDNESVETPVSGADQGTTGEEQPKDPKDPQEPTEEPTKDPIDVKDLKEKKFVTQVITPETLDNDNLSTYVTQTAVASELVGKL